MISTDLLCGGDGLQRSAAHAGWLRDKKIKTPASLLADKSLTSAPIDSRWVIGQRMESDEGCRQAGGLRGEGIWLYFCPYRQGGGSRDRLCVMEGWLNKCAEQRKLHPSVLRQREGGLKGSFLLWGWYSVILSVTQDKAWREISWYVGETFKSQRQLTKEKQRAPPDCSDLLFTQTHNFFNSVHIFGVLLEGWRSFSMQTEGF